MAGIIAVYSLVIAVLIASAITPDKKYSLFKYAGAIMTTSEESGFLHLAAGLSVGLTGLAAGYTIGIVGDTGVRAYMQQSRIFVGMVLILIFGEVLGLYGSRADRPPPPAPSDGAYRSRHAPPVSSPRPSNQSCSMPATHMATRPALPARHSSLFPQIGWLPSSRRNALVALEQDPVPPTSHSEPASPSGASSASSFSQWSPPPLNRWA
ncbi:MAG: hypothetical protein LQ339_001078 [Xanthoria mediterranea]|nr:MAG: hypothetical protein LQ339_001078 [Xanthoria mediterranea]